MKKNLIMLLFFGAAPAWALVPSKTSLDPHVLEVLSLPAENRVMAAKNSNKDIYKDLIKVAFADDQGLRVRWRALMLAAETYHEKATKDLVRASQHKEWFMRNASLVGLGEANPAEAQKQAQKLIKDKALVVRSAAVEILQKNLQQTPDLTVRDLLWEELDQKYNFRNQQSLWIRSQIVDALAQRPADHELKHFTQLINDSDVRVQSAAVSGLEKLTGTKLGDAKMDREKIVSLWRKHLREEKINL